MNIVSERISIAERHVLLIRMIERQIVEIAQAHTDIRTVMDDIKELAKDERDLIEKRDAALSDLRQTD